MFRDTYRQQQYITIFYTLSFVGLVVCQGEDVNFLLTTLITPLLVFLLAKMHCVFDRLNIENCMWYIRLLETILYKSTMVQI